MTVVGVSNDPAQSAPEARRAAPADYELQIRE